MHVSICFGKKKKKKVVFLPFHKKWALSCLSQVTDMARKIPGAEIWIGMCMKRVWFRGSIGSVVGELQYMQRWACAHYCVKEALNKMPRPFLFASLTE